MKNIAIFALCILNIITAYLLIEQKDASWKIRAAFDEQTVDISNGKATRTTDYERSTFGGPCLDWLKTEGAKDGKRGGDFMLGRSWKKHGQIVFEVIVPKDDIGKKTGDLICTYDVQSGMLYSYGGQSREPWMFY